MPVKAQRYYFNDMIQLEILNNNNNIKWKKK